MLVQDYEGDYVAIVEHLEGRLAGHFTVSSVDPMPEGRVAEIATYFPYNFGARFPIGAASELNHEGERAWGTADTTPGPAVIDIGIRIYTPSLLATGITVGAAEDGRQEARRVARRVYRLWRESFYADYELWQICQMVTLGRMVDGDHDAVGNPFTIPNDQDTILWVLTAPIRFTL